MNDKDSDKEPNKENTNINIVQKNVVITDANANRVKEIKAKRKDTSKQIASSVIKNANIPKFHYPLGRPGNKDDVEEVLLRVSQEFSKVEGGKVYKHQMPTIVKVCCNFLMVWALSWSEAETDIFLNCIWWLWWWWWQYAGLNFQQTIYWNIFIISFPENRFWHFMQIVSKYWITVSKYLERCTQYNITHTFKRA